MYVGRGVLRGLAGHGRGLVAGNAVVGNVVVGNVVALGAVSLVTDVSSEMVTAVLPVYLVAGLGLSPLAFGFLDGLYGGVTAFVRLAAGLGADRWQRHKLVAGLGYGLSAACKPLLLTVATVPGIAAVLALDRTGKGIRTAPRDALISLSSPVGAQGAAFGLHRAMDTAGALLGPLAAFAILAVAPGGYPAVFQVSACVAVFAVLMLALLVRGRASALPRPSFRGVVRSPGFGRIGVLAFALGAVTLSDPFVYLLLQDRLDLPVRLFPLLPVGSAAAFLVLAVPLGRAADRWGRRRVFLAGHAALLLVYGLLLSPVTGGALVVAVLLAHGAFYAATDGVLMALAGPLLPEGGRAGGLAVLQTAQAAARFVCSLAFGAAWSWWGPGPALAALAVLLPIVLGAAVAAGGQPSGRAAV
ncbi:MFS transporter [Actinocorallia longicatena]|uniref:MFS transporter n=1 Tax=Actinocorallia longicatena TaxID=111803 RepID=A0ABP6Q9J5_9ACTN